MKLKWFKLCKTRTKKYNIITISFTANTFKLFVLNFAKLEICKNMLKNFLIQTSRNECVSNQNSSIHFPNKYIISIIVNTGSKTN